LHINAVSNKPGILGFKRNRTSVAGRLSEAGEEKVDVICLSHWVESGKLKIPQLIKMDIEGEEYNVLLDIKDILKKHKPKIFLSTHGKNVHQMCVDFLKKLDYSLKPLDGGDLEGSKELLVY
jgi:FkbM family methyltransferase